MKLPLRFSHIKQVALFQKGGGEHKLQTLPVSDQEMLAMSTFFRLSSQKSNSSTVLPDGTESVPHFKNLKLFCLPVEVKRNLACDESAELVKWYDPFHLTLKFKKTKL